MRVAAVTVAVAVAAAALFFQFLLYCGVDNYSRRMKIVKQRESLLLTVLNSFGFGGASSEIKRAQPCQARGPL